MLQENLVNLRKAKGLSQEEVAVRLHVVRQTVSKWEKGLSVPDAHLLMALGELYEVSVSQLLGAPLQGQRELDAVAEQLSSINEQLAIKNRRSHRIWKTITITAIALVVAYILFLACTLIVVNVSSNRGTVQTIEVENE